MKTASFFYSNFHEKIDRKSSQKVRKTKTVPQNDKKADLGATFSVKDRILGDFGISGGSLGEDLGRILGITLADEKNDEKKVVSAVASAGHAYPGKEGFGRIPERPDLARLRSSFGWAGGLFTLRASRRGHMRLRGSEVCRTRWEDI